MPDPVLKGAVVVEDLDVGAVWDQLALVTQAHVLLAVKAREAPLARHNDELAARELHLCTAERLNHVRLVVVLAAHRHDGLANRHTRHLAVWLAVGTTHTGLKTVWCVLKGKEANTQAGRQAGSGVGEANTSNLVSE